MDKTNNNNYYPLSDYMNNHYDYAIFDFMPRYCPDCGKELPYLSTSFIQTWLDFRAGLLFTCPNCELKMFFIRFTSMQRTIQRLLDEKCIHFPDK